MLNTSLLKKFSTISVKLFFCFWLIAILSVVLTKFISEQFSEQTIVSKANKVDIKLLKNIKRELKVGSITKIERLLMNKRRVMYKYILLKNIENNQVKILHPGINKGLSEQKNYLEVNSFTQLVSIQFPRKRLTGPVEITLKNSPYQLYLVTRNNQRTFIHLIYEMPVWLRIFIPMMVSILLCWLLARTLSKPLSVMKATAIKIGDGDLSVRVEQVSNRNDELGSFARSFNQMAEKLEQSVNAQQMLLGDVSHELRSPMTRLQLAIGLASNNIEQPDKLKKHIDRCELEVSRLDKMLSDVLVHSRLENAIHTLEISLLDLTSSLDILLQDAQYLANEKHITLESTLIKPCLIQADGPLIASAINNVLTNAVKYSPANSVISVDLSVSEKQVSLVITDSGSGVPDADLDHLFTPFYRVAEARDRNTGGTGLGLAIAQQAVNAHGGSITAQNHTNKGLIVTILLPCN